MGNPNGLRAVLLLTPPLLLLFPVAVLVFVLERISSSLLLEQTDRNWRSGGLEITLEGPTSTGSNDTTNIDVTLRINQVPTRAIIGICILAYFVSALGTCGIWEMKKVQGTGGHQRVWGWVLLVSNVIMAGASIGVFAYATSVQSNEKGWQGYEDVAKVDQEFTRETWSCQIDNFYPEQDWAGSACGTAKATRFLLIPMAVSALLALVSLWVLVRARGGLKWLSGGKGRYAGFENVYEMQPTGAPASYATQPMPQWGPQPTNQWVSQPGQQWAAQPVQQWPMQPVSQQQKANVTTDQGQVFR